MSEIVVIKDPQPEVTVVDRPTTVEIRDRGDHLTISPAPTLVNVVPSVTLVHVVAGGPQGPIGPAGPGGAGYVHQQVSPAATWTINHNLGFFPDVFLIDTAAREFVAEVFHVNPNQTVILLDVARAGEARLS